MTTFNYLELAKLYPEYNLLINSIKQGGKSDNWTHYVWNPITRLYQKQIHIDYAITVLYSRIAKQAYLMRQFTIKQYHKCIYGFGSKKFTSRIHKWLTHYNIPSQLFADALDNHPTQFPIADGNIIDVTTLSIRPRNENDYFSKAYPWRYKPYLRDEANVFYKFIKSIWQDPDKIDYFTLTCGHLILPDNQSQNLLILWRQEKGGGGKTVFISTLFDLFYIHTVQIDRETIMTSNVKKFQLSTCIGKRCVYVDEAVPAKDRNVMKKVKNGLDISTLLKLSGGGIMNVADKHQPHSQVNAQHSRHSVLLLYNGDLFENILITDPIERRILMFLQKTYFRDPIVDEELFKDPNCKAYDPNLTYEIKHNMDDCFTWFMNAAHYYLKTAQQSLNNPNSKGFHLKNVMPEIMMNDLRNILEENNPKKLQFMKQFMKIKTHRTENKHIILSTFKEALNTYATSLDEKYIYTNEEVIIYTQNYSVFDNEGNRIKVKRNKYTKDLQVVADLSFNNDIQI